MDFWSVFDSWTDVLAGLAFLGYTAALVCLAAGSLTETLVRWAREGRK